MKRNAMLRSATLGSIVFTLLVVGAPSLRSTGNAFAADDLEADSQDAHIVTIMNKCDQQVWLGEFGSTDLPPHDWALAPACNAATAKQLCATGTCDNGACTCTTAADCTFGAPAGTETAKCDEKKKTCVNSVRVKVPPGWKGRFWPRTGCSGSSTSFACETGQCGPPSGGNIDCTAQNATGNQATLFELAAAGAGGTDNFDVSLVSGYNLPIDVKVQLTRDIAGWTADTQYSSGAQIVHKVKRNTFGFTNGGSSGTSGSSTPAFPDTWTGTVSDANGIVWDNTGPVCQTSGCDREGITSDNCPAALRITSSDGSYVGCDAPANACASSAAGCNSGLSYYQCQNIAGATDLFNNILTLQSPNAGTFVCFSDKDCPGGTSCQLNPTFATSFTLPSGAGVCTPVAQNGACQAGGDGQACAAFPFVEYVCQTLSGGAPNSQVCVPPTTTGFGNLWWNAANWSVVASSSCMQDSDCSGQQKCLTGPVRGGLKACAATDGSCSCYSPLSCSQSRGTNDGCPGPLQCLNSTGVPDGTGGADCSTQTCYCGPQGIYSGTCGPTNAGWATAAAALGTNGQSWPQVFKSACPVAYSYQFDDPSSNWSCKNSPSLLLGYKVRFCAGGGKGP
jgi:hypothetical protein